MRIYDSVVVADLPADPNAMYLGYVDGDWPNFQAVQARFPKNRVLSVMTSGFHKADICDVENGDATPQIAAAGVRQGLYDTVYSADAGLEALVTALAGLEWHWFCADWTGSEHLIGGSVATQWAAPGYGSPGNYDISVTNGQWPDPPPAPPVAGTFDTDHMEILMTLAASKNDALACQIREWWATYRTDTLTPAAVQYLEAGYNGSWNGSIDQVLATIIDTATTTGHLRPMFRGAA